MAPLSVPLLPHVCVPGTVPCPGPSSPVRQKRLQPPQPPWAAALLRRTSHPAASPRVPRNLGCGLRPAGGPSALGVTSYASECVLTRGTHVCEGPEVLPGWGPWSGRARAVDTCVVRGLSCKCSACFQGLVSVSWGGSGRVEPQLTLVIGRRGHRWRQAPLAQGGPGLQAGPAPLQAPHADRCAGQNPVCWRVWGRVSGPDAPGGADP